MPAALILERITVQHASTFDHPWPLLAGIAFRYMIIPVIAARDIALVPVISAVDVLRMLLIAKEVIVEYSVSCGMHYLQTERIVADVILVYLVIIGEI